MGWYQQLRAWGTTVPRPKTLLTCCCIALLAYPCAQSLGLECRITSSRVARTFYTGEPPVLNLQADGSTQSAAYEVTSYEGTRVASGRVQVGANRTVPLTFGAPGNGIYYVRVSFASGDVANDAFCVIPRPDADPGEPSLWGYQYGGTWECYYALMAQAGVRYVRFDLSWPDHERAAGQYDTAKADWYATVAKRYGLQIVPTLGYTPAWTAQQPDDYNVRSHTWAPESVEHWEGFVRTLRDRLADQTVTWPTTEVVPARPVPETRVAPLVRSWEIWNEADQNYYFGPWGRYLDLLRVAWGVLKGHSDRNVVCYGGACAHWTEMGMTYGAGCGPYFDEIAWHSNGDIEQSLPAYYYGSPQIGYKYWLPRPTHQTECYPTTLAGVQETGYLVRLFTALKAAGEQGYCYASIGGTLLGAADPNSRAMVYSGLGGELVPNAKYVAYAATRWLLQGAAYLGPLDLGPGVTAHLFVRRSLLLLVAWSDAGADVTLSLGEDNPRRVDALGRCTTLRGRSYQCRLTASPTVVLDMARAYAPVAMRAQFARAMATEYGFASSTDSPYVHDLWRDCAWGHPENDGQPQRLQATLEGCLGTMQSGRRLQWAALEPMLADLQRAMGNLAAAAASHQSLRAEVPTSIWRLQRLVEWLAAVLDVGTDRAGGALGGPALVRTLDAARAQVTDPLAGTIQPLSESLVDRGYAMGSMDGGLPRRGAVLAAQAAAAAALAYGRVETAKQTKVFVVGSFPTARLMRKAVLFPPAQTHQLVAQVYNYTPREVSGTVTWSLPSEWVALSPSVSFTAPAQGHSARVLCEMSIPDGAQPWPLRWASVAGCNFRVALPSQLSAVTSLSVQATLSDGRATATMPYQVCTGVWTP
jgi:hypothetical protein